MTANGQLAHLFCTCMRENNSPNQKVSVVCIHHFIYLQIFGMFSKDGDVKLEEPFVVFPLEVIVRLLSLLSFFFLFTGSLSWSANQSDFTTQRLWPWFNMLSWPKSHSSGLTSADNAENTTKTRPTDAQWPLKYTASLPKKKNYWWLILHSRACTHFLSNQIMFIMRMSLILISSDIF